MKAQTVIRNLAKGLFFIAITIIALNIEKITEANGWDQFLLKDLIPTLSKARDFLKSPWVQYPATLTLGLAIGYAFNIRDHQNKVEKNPSEHDSQGSLRIISNQRFVRCPIKIDGNHFINCEFERVFVTWDGGPYAFENCIIDATRVDGFQTNSPDISKQMQLFAMLGLLHPRGTRSMGLPIEPGDEILFQNEGVSRKEATNNADPLGPPTFLVIKFEDATHAKAIGVANILKWSILQASGSNYVDVEIEFKNDLPNLNARLGVNSNSVKTELIRSTVKKFIVRIKGDVAGKTAEMHFGVQPEPIPNF